jgi:hypothetical protein
MSEEFMVALISIGVCVALPVLVVWLNMRAQMNKDNANKAVLLAAIEKDSALDVEQFINKLSPRKKLLKEKLLSKLLWAIICMIVGVAVIAIGIYLTATAKYDFDAAVWYFVGGTLLAVGIACLVTFFVGKKMLAKEIEAEEVQKARQ